MKLSCKYRKSECRKTQPSQQEPHREAAPPSHLTHEKSLHSQTTHHRAFQTKGSYASLQGKIYYFAKTLSLSLSLSLPPPPLPLKTLFVWSNFFNLLQSRTDPNYHISMCWSYVSAPNCSSIVSATQRGNGEQEERN